MPITITHKNVIAFFCCLMVVAMVISPVLLSISMMGLGAMALFKLDLREGKLSFVLNHSGIQRMKKVLEHPVFVVVTLSFIIALLRFYPIGDWDYLLVRLRIKAPFLLLPIAFLGLPRFSEDDLRKLLYFVLIFLSIVSFCVLMNYFSNYEILTEQIKKGHHIPTPRNHIRYSLLVAFAVIGGVYLWLKRFRFKHKHDRWFIASLTVFLFLFLHLLSVKSGLLVLYICLGFGLLQYVWIKRKIAVGVAGLALLVSVPMIAYHTIPTFHNKVRYFQYDMFMHQQGEGGQYSDSGRIASLQTGWALVKKNWLWGVGTANMRDEVWDYYKVHYPEYPEAFMPQNQFLFSWASAGVFGLIVTIIAFFMPLLYRKNYRHPLFLNFYLSIFIIITIEHALENAVGVAHYLFFLLFFLSLLNRGSKKINAKWEE